MNPKNRPARGDYSPGRPPDYHVAALDKRTEARSNIGSAWTNEDGRIQIKLNAFLVLDTTRMELVISLFPNDREEPRGRRPKGGPPADDDGPPPVGEPEMPF